MESVRESHGQTSVTQLVTSPPEILLCRSSKPVMLWFSPSLASRFCIPMFWTWPSAGMPMILKTSSPGTSIVGSTSAARHGCLVFNIWTNPSWFCRRWSMLHGKEPRATISSAILTCNQTVIQKHLDNFRHSSVSWKLMLMRLCLPKCSDEKTTENPQ